MNFRPGQIALLAGGALIFISTFLDWFGFGSFGASAYEGDLFGFTGIFLLLLSVGIIALTAIAVFAPQVNLPDQVLGFSMNELALMAGFASLVWGFSMAVRDGSKGGTLLCAVGGVAVVVGAFLEIRSTDTAPSGPPQTI